jgi:hypothetical protein
VLVLTEVELTAVLVELELAVLVVELIVLLLELLTVLAELELAVFVDELLVDVELLDVLIPVILTVVVDEEIGEVDTPMLLPTLAPVVGTLLHVNSEVVAVNDVTSQAGEEAFAPTINAVIGVVIEYELTALPDNGYLHVVVSPETTLAQVPVGNNVIGVGATLVMLTEVIGVETGLVETAMELPMLAPLVGILMHLSSEVIVVTVDIEHVPEPVVPAIVAVVGAPIV